MIIIRTNNDDTIDADDGVTNLSDYIFAGGGRDTIFGLGGADHIFGENGDDILTGGAGGDLLDGGTGVDTASYSDSGWRVTVNLITGSGTGGTAEGDTLISIEHVAGSGHDDLLIGDGGNNVLMGLSGDDTLKGGFWERTPWPECSATTPRTTMGRCRPSTWGLILPDIAAGGDA